jgi:hypothetical protein
VVSYEDIKAPKQVDGVHNPPAFLRLALANCFAKLPNGLLVGSKSLLAAGELKEQTGGPVRRHVH